MDLKTFFAENPTGAVAFSGGLNSSFLLWAAAEYGKDWHAYFLRTAFQPDTETQDVQMISSHYQIPLTILNGDIFLCADIISNTEKRCSLCKQRMFSAISQKAKQDGYHLLIDGTVCDSLSAAECPQIRDFSAILLRSPLKEYGLSKSDLRLLARKIHLPNWNKTAYSCLATRVAHGTAITREHLQHVQRAETLLSSLGFQNYRVQVSDDALTLLFPHHQISYAQTMRTTIDKQLSPLFPSIIIRTF